MEMGLKPELKSKQKISRKCGKENVPRTNVRNGVGNNFWGLQGYFIF